MCDLRVGPLHPNLAGHGCPINDWTTVFTIRVIGQVEKFLDGFNSQQRIERLKLNDFEIRNLTRQFLQRLANQLVLFRPSLQNQLLGDLIRGQANARRTGQELRNNVVRQLQLNSNNFVPLENGNNCRRHIIFCANWFDVHLEHKILQVLDFVSRAFSVKCCSESIGADRDFLTHIRTLFQSKMRTRDGQDLFGCDVIQNPPLNGCTSGRSRVFRAANHLRYGLHIFCHVGHHQLTGCWQADHSTLDTDELFNFFDQLFWIETFQTEKALHWLVVTTPIEFFAVHQVG